MTFRDEWWSGAIGETGPEGPAGPQGLQGVAGPQGATGPQGPAGADGAAGPAGNDGATGPAGANGAQGPSGPAGSQGIQGLTGDTGPQGLQGIPGLSGSITYAGAALGADVAMAVTGTWYDGPSVSLAAGTWLVVSHTTFRRTATTATQWVSRISTGSVHYASSQAYTPSVAGITASVSLTTIVTIIATTTVKVQGTTSAGAAACLMSAATPNSGSGNNATSIRAIKLA